MFTVQLAVGAVGRKELETGYPIRVIIDDKMEQLIRQASGMGRVVIGSNHGPRVDVEQWTARAWHAIAYLRQCILC